MELSEEVKKIRKEWSISDAKRDEGLTTPDDIRRFDDISYGPYGKENLLDIYVQKDVTTIQPTIFNIHGGGWVYGSKEIYQFYCMSLAQRGFTVVNINYRLAPENRFPAAVTDVNQALTFIAEHGEEYFIDKDRLILVGDSAGAQLTTHYATIYSNEEFARLFDFKVPDITVKAVGLNCGAYNSKALIKRKRKNNTFLEYVDGIDKPVDEEVIKRVDALSYINSNFPPAYIMSCKNDFLLGSLRPMYFFLKKKKVECQKKVYGTRRQKEIAHVFHVNIKLEEAKKCNDDEAAFFKKYVKADKYNEILD